MGAGLGYCPDKRGEVIGSLWGHSEATEQCESQLFKRQTSLGEGCLPSLMAVRGGRGGGQNKNTETHIGIHLHKAIENHGRRILCTASKNVKVNTPWDIQNKYNQTEPM